MTDKAEQSFQFGRALSDIQSLSSCEPRGTVWSHNRPEGELGHRWCAAAATGLYTQVCTACTNAHSLTTLCHTHMPTNCISVHSACQHKCVKGQLIDRTAGMQMCVPACTYIYRVHNVVNHLSIHTDRYTHPHTHSNVIHKYNPLLSQAMHAVHTRLHQAIVQNILPASGPHTWQHKVCRSQLKRKDDSLMTR